MGNVVFVTIVRSLLLFFALFPYTYKKKFPDKECSSVDKRIVKDIFIHILNKFIHSFVDSFIGPH